MAASQSEVNHGNLRDQMGSDRSLLAVLPIFRVYSFAFAFPSPASASAQTSLAIRIPGGERREAGASVASRVAQEMGRGDDGPKEEGDEDGDGVGVTRHTALAWLGEIGKREKFRDFNSGI